MTGAKWKPDATLAELKAMSRPELATLWGKAFKTPVPRRMSAVHMRRAIAYEIQAASGHGLSKRVRSKLIAIARDKARPKAKGVDPGATLIREWNGVTHTVDVLENGYAWRGQTYRSLSAVASAITGARWSGPRFFGIKASAQ